MDSLSKRIVPLLRRDGRVSYSRIANRLGATRAAVASRVNAMLRSGELRIIAAPHPRLLGLAVGAHISLRVSGTIQGVLRALERMDSLSFISVTTGPYALVAETELRTLGELSQQIAVLRELERVSDIQVLLYEQVLDSFFLGSRPPRDASVKLDDTDRRIIETLQRNGRASYEALSQEVGLSLSGCRLRMRRLLASGLIHIGAIPRRSDMTDDLVFGVGITAQGDQTEVIKLLRGDPGLEFMARVVGRYDLIATLAFASLREFNRLIGRVRALPSVSGCEPWLHLQLVRERYERNIASL